MDDQSTDQTEQTGPSHHQTQLPVAKVDWCFPLKKKALKRKYLVAPSFVPSEDPKGKNKISAKDISELILWVLNSTTPTSGPASPRWIRVTNHQRITRFVALYVPGLPKELFGFDENSGNNPSSFNAISELSFFDSTFSHAWPTEAPGSRDRMHSFAMDFVTVEMSKLERKKLRKQKDRAAKLEQISYKDLIMTTAAMSAHGYPSHPTIASSDSGGSLPDGWAATKDLGKPEQQLFAIDCEMCRSEQGLVLTRATIIDHNGKSIYDKLVKPSQPIVDYVTRYSGISEEMLKDVTTTLEDVQNDFLYLISSNDVMIGHSLESDLQALQLQHPNIIDTAVSFHHPRSAQLKPSLKWLTQKFLKRNIQTGSDGHDSAEDATACLDLVNLKISNGLGFGERDNTSGNLVRMLLESEPSRTTAVIDYGARSAIHDGAAQTVISCTDDDEIVSNVLTQAPKHNLTWARLRGLDFGLGWSSTGRNDDDEEIRSNPTKEQVTELYEELNARLQKLYNGLPDDTAVIIMTGHGDPRPMNEMLQRRKKFTAEFDAANPKKNSVLWTQTDELKLPSAVYKVRFGLSFLTVKTEEPSGDEEHASKRSATPVDHVEVD